MDVNPVGSMPSTTEFKTLSKVQVRIRDTLILALVDTGASISCLSPDVFESLELNAQFPLKEPRIKSVKGVGNYHVEALGDVTE